MLHGVMSCCTRFTKCRTRCRRPDGQVPVAAIRSRSSQLRLQMSVVIMVSNSLLLQGWIEVVGSSPTVSNAFEPAQTANTTWKPVVWPT
jgi:hypothetical protein